MKLIAELQDVERQMRDLGRALKTVLDDWRRVGVLRRS
jgi:hypothetical protein